MSQQNGADQPRIEEAEMHEKPGRLRILLPLLPLIVFVALAAVFLMRIGDRNDAIPSALIGQKAPLTDLPPLAGTGQSDNLTNKDFEGKTTLVNVWSSWCVPCRQEIPVMMELARDKRFEIVGINYKDSPEKAKAFLAELGNPFAKIGVDAKGRQSINWGVYGIPETFIVNRDGIITYKHTGPLTPENIKNDVMPQLEKAIQGITDKEG